MPDPKTLSANQRWCCNVEEGKGGNPGLLCSLSARWGEAEQGVTRDRRREEKRSEEKRREEEGGDARLDDIYGSSIASNRDTNERKSGNETI